MKTNFLEKWHKKNGGNSLSKIFLSWTFIYIKQFELSNVRNCSIDMTYANFS